MGLSLGQSYLNQPLVGAAKHFDQIKRAPYLILLEITQSTLWIVDLELNLGVKLNQKHPQHL